MNRLRALQNKLKEMDKIYPPNQPYVYNYNTAQHDWNRFWLKYEIDNYNL